MSVSETRISRRLLVAGGAAFGAGLLTAPALAQGLEKVTYLFPAPPLLPAFGPIQLAKGKGYFTEAGLDVTFAVGPRRRRRRQAGRRRQCAARRHRGGRADHGPRQRRAGEDRRGVRRQGIHAAGGARGFRHREAGRPQGQDHHRHVLPGHDLLCAARPARERGPHPERRQHPVGRPDRRLAVRRRRQIGRHGRRAGLDPADPGDGREGQGAADRRVFPAHGAGHRGVRRHDQAEAGDDPQVRRARRCAA